MNIERMTCGICGCGFDLPEDDKPRQPGLPFAVCSRPRCGDAATILGRTFTVLRAPRPHRRTQDYAQRAEELVRGLKTFTDLDKQSQERWFHRELPSTERLAEELRTAAENLPTADDDGPYRVNVEPVDHGTLTEKGIAERVRIAVNAAEQRALLKYVERLTAFLYILMRDEVPTGVVRKIQRDHIDKAGDRERIYSEPGLVMVARCAAAELLEGYIAAKTMGPCPRIVVVDGVECCGCDTRPHSVPGGAGDGRDGSYPLREEARRPR
jgi:hypothetical protein